jgi:hypothetical protein
MGPDQLGEIRKPKKSAWAEEKMEDGAFGEEGAGFESVAGGGLHSLFVDEKGTVSCPSNLVDKSKPYCRFGPVVSMMMQPSEESPKTSPIQKNPARSLILTISRHTLILCKPSLTKISEPLNSPLETPFQQLSARTAICEFGARSG